MIEVSVAGWNEIYGPYRFTVPFDDKRRDYEVRFADGSTSTQKSAFDYVTRDWNCDGDVYAQYGAWFENDRAASDFFTPEQLVWLVADDDATIPGIRDPKAPVKQAIQEHEEKLKAYPVEVRDKNGRKRMFRINTTETHYRVYTASGREWFQTSGFQEETEKRAGRGKTDRRVFGVWFQSEGEPRSAHFSTPEELAQMVADGKATIEGYESRIEPDPTGKKKISREADR